MNTSSIDVLSNTQPETMSPKRRKSSGIVRLVKYMKPKRSNRTAATRSSFCEDDASFLDEFKQDEIIIKGLKKKHRKKTWSQSSSGSLSSLSSSCQRNSGRSWRLRKSQTERDEEALLSLLGMADVELDTGHADRAYACWRQARNLSRDSDEPEIVILNQCALWKLALYHTSQECSKPREDQEPAEDSFDRTEALEYLKQIDFELCPDDWLLDVVSEKEACLLLTLLMEASQWRTALRLAGSMNDVSTRTIELCRFQIAQQSGSLEQLENCECQDRDLKRRVLLALSQAYAHRQDWDLALATNSRLESATPLETAEALSQKAEFCISSGRTEAAWEALAEGFEVAENDSDASLLLLQTKAQLLFKSGNLVESLNVHNELLNSWRKIRGPVCPEVAKTYYTMGRIWCRANNAYKAVECFRQELHVTQLALGKNHSEVARILHEIARLYDEHLGDYDKALSSYQNALQVEQFLLEECRKRAKTSALHQQRYGEHLMQIRETQKCMGRVHYKMGDFSMAVRTSFDARSTVQNA